jgi:NAD(P)-dependent dehydrogenase (short-subunit alcohol dehydrogenase family)
MDAEAVKQRTIRTQQFCTSEIPLGRPAEAYELKGLAVLLASEASSYITDQVFVQDGGQSARL